MTSSPTTGDLQVSGGQTTGLRMLPIPTSTTRRHAHALDARYYCNTPCHGMQCPFLAAAIDVCLEWRRAFDVDTAGGPPRNIHRLRLPMPSITRNRDLPFHRSGPTSSTRAALLRSRGSSNARLKAPFSEHIHEAFGEELRRGVLSGSSRSSRGLRTRQPHV